MQAPPRQRLFCGRLGRVCRAVLLNTKTTKVAKDTKALRAARSAGGAKLFVVFVVFVTFVSNSSAWRRVRAAPQPVKIQSPERLASATPASTTWPPSKLITVSAPTWATA